MNKELVTYFNRILAPTAVTPQYTHLRFTCFRLYAVNISETFTPRVPAARSFLNKASERESC